MTTHSTSWLHIETTQTTLVHLGGKQVCDGLLVRGDRIVVPFSLRKQILEKIHEGHMGMAKCRERAAQSVWWPRIGKDIKSQVASCRHCLEKQPSQASEPLLPSALPDRPFQKVGIDICEFRNKHYLVQVDYYSRYIDVTYLPSLTSATVIRKLKNFFSHHGVPETVVSDNGTQFSSAEFRTFADRWNFNHVTSSPHYPQSNGAAERAVKTVKEILRQDDIFLALLSYRSTPIPDLGASPAELAMGRKLRATMPSLPLTLQPRVVSHKEVRERDAGMKRRQKEDYDRRHGVQPLPELSPGDPVSSKRMERRAGSCRERWWGSALHIHSWYRHQEVTCIGTAIWNRSLHLRAIQMTSVTRSQEQSSLQTTRWDRSLTQLRLLTSSPVYTWLGSPGHQWQADHHHHRRLQGTLHFHRCSLHTSLLQCRHSLQCLQPYPFAPDMATSSISLPDIGGFVCSVVPKLPTYSRTKIKARCEHDNIINIHYLHQ